MNNLTERKGNWADIKEKLKEKFGMLTTSDHLLANSKDEEMLCRLQTKLGRTKEEVRRIILNL